MTYRVVWFKRDLRVHDHAPLHAAAQQGPVLCLYLIEPSLWRQPDAATQHYHFIRESLVTLDRQLQALGSQLHVAVGEAVEVLAALHAHAPFAALHAHEETGNALTYDRDRAVARWCRNQGVAWREWPQFGVVRGLRDRNHWSAHWEQHMRQPIGRMPDRLRPPAGAGLAPGVVPLVQATWPTPASLGLDPFEPPRRQRGGRDRAEAVLHDFWHDRCARYRGGISSPLSAPDACSRLSPYLAYGCLSLREVVQGTRAQLQHTDPALRRHRMGLQAFMSRLYWHCHFIQKLESEPELEWRNLHRGYDGLREHDHNPAHWQALMDGRTGWPMVDACVAMLRETGWLNFRMRAMLVSVAAYPLWLHWREVGLWLARQFLDYEPGIHWSQLQMQSGTTGINTTRVYNPIKQAHDHDPQGRFVRRWLPAMRRVPDTWLFEPWHMPDDVQRRCGLQPGQDLPVPLVDLDSATRRAKERVYALRRDPQVRAAKAEVVQRHGSRRTTGNATGSGPRTRSRASCDVASHQLSLDL